MSMSQNEEILSAIRYAPGPISAVDIYEQCRGIESIKDVSSRLSQLFAQGKVAREEIVTANNRKGFAYSLPKKQPAGEAAAAPAEAGNPASDIPTLGELLGAPEKPVVPAKAAKPARKAKPKADPVAAGLDQVAAAVSASKVQPETAKPATDAARIADAIIAHLKPLLAPRIGNPLTPVSVDGDRVIDIRIHIDQVDIHLGGL